MARVAYVILSYKLPDQVLRLVRRLRAGSPGGQIVIHHDGRAATLDRVALREAGAHVLEDSGPVEWGDFSQLAAVLRAFAWLLRHTDFEWVVLLSGQDYPVRPVPEIEADLASTPCDGFIASRVVPRPALGRPLAEFPARYFYRYATVPDGPLSRALAARAARARPLVVVRRLPSGLRLGVRCLRDPFAGLVCRQGADWFTLSRRCVETVEASTRTTPEVLRHYRRTIIPTESFVHTVLGADASLRLSGDPRRYWLWADGAPHPRVLRREDLGPAFAGGVDFGRKFDETIDATALDRVDREVHGGPVAPRD